MVLDRETLRLTAGVAGVGVAAALAALALRPALLTVFRRHRTLVRDTAARFSPRPVPEVRTVLLAYLAWALLLGLLISIAPNPLIALFLWALTLPLPKVLIEYAWARRRRRIDRQLPQAIAMLANCVRSGLTLVQSTQRLTRTLPEPVRTEFHVLYNRYAHGMDLERTILESKRRLNLENFNLFATALLVNRELGGNIALTLDRIAQSLERLAQMRRTIEVQTSEGRTNIKVLLCAPVLMLLMLATVDAEGVRLLFSTPQGWCVLIVAGGLTGFGLYWAGKIIHSEV